jgi:hypothetical protein
VKGKFNYKNKIILKLFCRLTKFDVYKVTTHLCVPQFFHGQTCCQPAIRHKQLYSRFTVTCTFGPVLLPIPKFESLQFAIAKELGKNKQRHRLRVNSIIWWRNQTCIIDKFIKQRKNKNFQTDRFFCIWKSVRNSATASINFYTTLMNFLFGSYKLMSQSKFVARQNLVLEMLNSWSWKCRSNVVGYFMVFLLYTF